MNIPSVKASRESARSALHALPLSALVIIVARSNPSSNDSYVHSSSSNSRDGAIRILLGHGSLGATMTAIADRCELCVCVCIRNIPDAIPTRAEKLQRGGM